MTILEQIAIFRINLKMIFQYQLKNINININLKIQDTCCLEAV